MTHLELRNRNYEHINEIGFWLEANMPKPLLEEEDPPRWIVGQSTDGRMGIAFRDEVDAIRFSLVWL